MTTTLATIPIVAREAEELINPFTLRTIHARDLMVDSAGMFSFFYGPITRRPSGRVEIRQTAPGVYSIEIAHIDPRTNELVQDRAVHDVPATDLRNIIQELT